MVGQTRRTGSRRCFKTTRLARTFLTKKRNSPIDDSLKFFSLVSWSSRSSQATQAPKEVVRLTRKPRNHSRCDRGCVYVRDVSLVKRHPHSRARAVCGCGGFYHYSMRGYTRHTVSGVMTISSITAYYSPLALFPRFGSSRCFASSSHSTMTSFRTGRFWGLVTMTSVCHYCTVLYMYI
jgi:hypothetical protein